MQRRRTRILSMPSSLLLFTSASWPAAPAWGASLCVNPGGTSGCFASIQAAVDAADLFDVIDVAAGTYTESIAIGPGHILTLQGAGVGATIVDGGGVGDGTRVIAVDGNSTRVTLFGVTLQNTEAGVQTGEGVDGRPRVTLLNVEITGTRYGVFARRGKIAIDGAYVHDNQWDGIIFFSKATLQLVRSTVSRSGFTGVAGYPIANVGFNTPPVARIEDSTISGNADGVTNARGRISRSTITANSGIGLNAYQSRRPTIDATVLSANGTDCDGPIRSRGFNVVG